MLNLDKLGQRICIIGPSSSGKSTLAQKLGAKMNAKVTHLDQLAHIPNTKWIRRPLEEFIQDHNKIIETERWVVEGNYSICMPQRFEKATAVIWLEPSLSAFIYRYIKRSLLNEAKRPGKLDGAKGEVSLALIKHTFFTYPKNRKKYQKLLEDRNLFVLHIGSMTILNEYYRQWALDEI